MDCDQEYGGACSSFYVFNFGGQVEPWRNKTKPNAALLQHCRRKPRVRTRLDACPITEGLQIGLRTATVVVHGVDVAEKGLADGERLFSERRGWGVCSRLVESRSDLVWTFSQRTTRAPVPKYLS